MNYNSAITTGCFGAANAIAKTAVALAAFVRQVRPARADLDAVSRELHSLDAVLDLLRDDANSMPPDLARRTPQVLSHCNAVVAELDGLVAALDGPGLSPHDKKLRWAAARNDMSKLRISTDTSRRSAWRWT